MEGSKQDEEKTCDLFDGDCFARIMKGAKEWHLCCPRRYPRETLHLFSTEFTLVRLPITIVDQPTQNKAEPLAARFALHLSESHPTTPFRRRPADRRQESFSIHYDDYVTDRKTSHQE